MGLLWFQLPDKKIEAKRDRLYRVAYSWCHDPYLADDLVNDALYKAVRNKGKLRELEKLDGWLFRILANCWHDYLRTQRPHDNIDDVQLTETDTPELAHGREQLSLQVRRAVAQLGVAQREVVTLVDLEEFSYKEVAEILDVPMGTVMSRLNRARAALRRGLLSSEVSTSPRKGGVSELRSVK